MYCFYRRAVALMSWNDLEIRHRGKFSYQVPVDECKVSLQFGVTGDMII